MKKIKLNSDQQIVWKVVDYNLTSATTWSSKFQILYKLGEYVKPVESKYKIFCFKTRDQARTAKKNWSGNTIGTREYRIYKSIAINVSAPPAPNIGSPDPFNIERYWNSSCEYNERYFNNPIPDGTLFCDELMLIEKSN